MALRDGAHDGSQISTVGAIRYAIKNKARVINISQGAIGVSLTSDYVDAVSQAIKAGIVVIAGAGNEGMGNVTSISNLPGVIAVGSTGPDDRRAKRSNPGSVPSNYGIDSIWSRQVTMYLYLILLQTNRMTRWLPALRWRLLKSLAWPPYSWPKTHAAPRRKSATCFARPPMISSVTRLKTRPDATSIMAMAA
jgi:hypothetical protein